MIRIGLTGSIGMGKSTVAAMFGARGVPVFDADAAVHRLQGAGGALVAAIETAFPGTTGEAGVDRTKLGEAVLGDPQALKHLEALVHPAVGAERSKFLARHHDSTLVLLDIPLLYETGGEQTVDKVVVVSAPPEVQRQRVMARAGMTADRFAAILARQTPDSEKRARADYVIPTGGTLAATQREVDALIACLAG